MGEKYYHELAVLFNLILSNEFKPVIANNIFMYIKLLFAISGLIEYLF